MKYIILQNTRPLPNFESICLVRRHSNGTHPLHLYQFTFGNTRVTANPKREVQSFRAKSGRHNVRHLRKDGKRGR